MNKPPFSRWAMECQSVPAMESFGDMLNKLKSFFKGDDKKPSEVTSKEKRAYVQQIRNFIKSRYLNKDWIAQQTFKTEPIDIGKIGSIFELKGTRAADVLHSANTSLQTIVNIHEEFKKYFKIREAEQIKIYKQLQDLERKFDIKKEEQLISESSGFDKIVKQYLELPFPFEQMRMEQYKVHGLEFVPKGHSYQVKYVSYHTTSHKVNPLTSQDVLKFGEMLDRVLSSLQNYDDIAVAFNCPSSQGWDSDFKLGDDLWNEDEKFAHFAARLAWDGDINNDREFFDGKLAHRSDGWTARGGLDVFIYDIAFALEKVITMSIK